MNGVRTRNFTGDMHRLHISCKSNYHTIMTTTVPLHSVYIVNILSLHSFDIYVLTSNTLFLYLSGIQILGLKNLLVVLMNKILIK